MNNPAMEILTCVVDLSQILLPWWILSNSFWEQCSHVPPLLPPLVALALNYSYTTGILALKHYFQTSYPSWILSCFRNINFIETSFFSLLISLQHFRSECYFYSRINNIYFYRHWLCTKNKIKLSHPLYPWPKATLSEALSPNQVITELFNLSLVTFEIVKPST